MRHLRSVFSFNISAILIALAISGSANASTTIHVPSEQATIQKAIDASSDGDTVLVSPGVYTENINFHGKAITVKSAGGPSATIIDGGQMGAVVTFDSGEELNSVLEGFTIQNGLGGVFTGGGIQIVASSPTIKNNAVTANTSDCSAGSGINVWQGRAPLLEGNIVTSNHLSPTCSGFELGGVAVQIPTGGRIIGNLISNNDAGGLALLGAANLTVQQNAVLYNAGIGIDMFGSNGAGIELIQNVVAGNQGPGIFSDSYNFPPSLVVNNTVTNNALLSAGESPASEFAVALTTLDKNVIIENNLFVATGNAPAVLFFPDSANPPIFSNNDVFGARGGPYVPGSPPDQTGISGNISADPIFLGGLGSHNYLLGPGSPAIDTGDSHAPSLPPVDLFGNPRILGGGVDIGAYEYAAKNVLAFSEYSVDFGVQTEGVASASRLVTLTNLGPQSVQIYAIAVGSDFKQTNDCGASLGSAAHCTIQVSFRPVHFGPRNDALGVVTSATENPLTLSLSGTGTPAGDVNGDGVVNCLDLALVKASFGTRTGQPGFNPAADVNHDGVVNILDLAFVAKQLPAGTTCR